MKISFLIATKGVSTPVPIHIHAQVRKHTYIQTDICTYIPLCDSNCGSSLDPLQYSDMVNYGTKVNNTYEYLSGNS